MGRASETAAHLLLVFFHSSRARLKVTVWEKEKDIRIGLQLIPEYMRNDKATSARPKHGQNDKLD